MRTHQFKLLRNVKLEVFGLHAVHCGNWIEFTFNLIINFSKNSVFALKNSKSIECLDLVEIWTELGWKMSFGEIVLSFRVPRIFVTVTKNIWGQYDNSICGQYDNSN